MRGAVIHANTTRRTLFKKNQLRARSRRPSLNGTACHCLIPPQLHSATPQLIKDTAVHHELLHLYYMIAPNEP